MSDDFVTVRECEIKDENLRRSIEHLRESLEKYIEHSSGVEARWFQRQDELSNVLSAESEKAKSTQKELSEHKDNHWQWAGLILTLSGVVATIIVEMVKK